MMSFQEFLLPEKLKNNVKKMGFNEPTPIQAKVLPLAFQGHDVIGLAQTGSGKTAAYAIPGVKYLLENNQGKILILVPTRELASQVAEVFKKLILDTSLKQALLVGGVPMYKQIRDLKFKPRIFIGTPGRINDLLKRKMLRLEDVQYLVFDEVDRMLDIGFQVQVDEILKYLKQKKQTLFFSATLSPKVSSLVKNYLIDPKKITIGTINKPVALLEQKTIKVNEKEKYTSLKDALIKIDGSSLIFVKTKHMSANLAKKLKEDGFFTEAFHGDLSQGARNRAIQSFKRNDKAILVATDIASRGLDIDHIKCVFNFDLPHNPEDFVHRVGRTARAGRTGQSITFLSRKDEFLWKKILRLINS